MVLIITVILLGIMPFFCVYSYRLGLKDGQRLQLGQEILPKKVESAPMDKENQEMFDLINNYSPYEVPDGSK